MMTLATQADTTTEDAKAAILNYINSRLDEWAEWSQQGSNLGVGYPPCAIEYRMMTEGHVTRGYSGLTPLPTHPAAEEMEQLICEMAAQNHKMAQVITFYHLHPGGIRDHARQLNMSHAYFETHLNTARWWLAGRLSTREHIKILTRHFKALQES